MPLPFYPDVTVDSSFPLTGLTEATLDFAALPGRLAWVEFDEGFIRSGQIVDRGSYARYAITGALAGGGETFTSGDGFERGGAVFDGTQSIDLGSIFPTSADYSIFAVYKQAGGGSAAGLLGGAGASYHSLHLNVSNGRINLNHAAAAQYAGTTDHALGSLMRVGAIWTESPKTYTIQVNGANEASAAGTNSNTDPTAVIGDIPGLSGDRNFRGTMLHLSLWSVAAADENLAKINAYLAEQYAP